MAIVSHREDILHPSLYLERRGPTASPSSPHLRERRLVGLDVFVPQHIGGMHRELHAEGFGYNGDMSDLESCTFSAECKYPQFDT